MKNPVEIVAVKGGPMQSKLMKHPLEQHSRRTIVTCMNKMFQRVN